MTDTTWPDPARPGYPLNPEQDGHHWFRAESGNQFLVYWTWDHIEQTGWWSSIWDGRPVPVMLSGITYLGPCLTPAERDAAIAASRMDERRRAAEVCLAGALAIAVSHDMDLMPAFEAHRHDATTILAQPAPDGADALAAMLAEAERRGIERALAAARDKLQRAEALCLDAQADGIGDACDAIRALLEPPA